MDYFLARYYGSSLGRFTSVDPGNAGATVVNPQTWNGYAYVNNNPTAFVDPNGESATFFGALGGGIIGGAVAAYRGEDISTGVLKGAVAGALAGSVIDTGGASLAVIAASGAVGGGSAVALDQTFAGQDVNAVDVAKGAAIGAVVGPVVAKASGAVVGAVRSGQTSSTTKLLSAPQSRGNPNTASAPAKVVVDPKGNAIPLKPGETVTGSPDGRFVQVRDAQGRPTGMRLDGPHKPSTHPDTRAQQPHAHVPGRTNPDGTPWLPVNQ